MNDIQLQEELDHNPHNESELQRLHVQDVIDCHARQRPHNEKIAKLVSQGRFVVVRTTFDEEQAVAESHEHVEDWGIRQFAERRASQFNNSLDEWQGSFTSYSVLPQIPREQVDKEEQERQARLQHDQLSTQRASTEYQSRDDIPF
jgi:hypothetical protein